jgi:hypothetical protein
MDKPSPITRMKMPNFNEGKNKYLLIIMREKIPSHKDVGHAPLKEEQTFYPSVQSSSI